MVLRAVGSHRRGSRPSGGFPGLFFLRVIAGYSRAERSAEQCDGLFSGSKFGGRVAKTDGGAAWDIRAAARLDTEALDLLVWRRKRDLESLGGFGLIPVRALEHVHDDSPLHFFENFK